MADDKELVRFFCEMGQLRRIKHEGIRRAGVDNPPSVADHGLRVAQIAFVLARLEGVDAHKACAMAVFHDMAEARVGDIEKIQARYIKVEEERAAAEQTEALGEIGKEIFTMWKAVEDKNGPEGIVAKDADYLEQAFEAKGYLETGHEIARLWIHYATKALRTKSAQRLAKQLLKTKTHEWWVGLEIMPK